MITQNELKERCHYDPDSGVFVWKNPISNRVKRGQVIGHRTAKGYLQVRLNGRLISLHRLAWLYIHGTLPNDRMDHINGNRSDNRISNLRECSQRQNLQNQRKPHAGNKSGFLGVHRSKKNKKNPWVAQIQHKGKVMYIGCFRLPEDAHAAYVAKKREIHEFGVI